METSWFNFFDSIMRIPAIRNLTQRYINAGNNSIAASEAFHREVARIRAREM